MKLAKVYAGWIAEAMGDGWTSRVAGVTEDGYAVIHLTHPKSDRVVVEVHPEQLDDRSAAVACADRVRG